MAMVIDSFDDRGDQLIKINEFPQFCDGCKTEWISRIRNPKHCKNCGMVLQRDSERLGESKLSKEKQSFIIGILLHMKMPRATIYRWLKDPKLFDPSKAADIDLISKSRVTIFDCLFAEQPKIPAFEELSKALDAVYAKGTHGNEPLTTAVRKFLDTYYHPARTDK